MENTELRNKEKRLFNQIFDSAEREKKANEQHVVEQVSMKRLHEDEQIRLKLQHGDEEIKMKRQLDSAAEELMQLMVKLNAQDAGTFISSALQ